MVCSTCPRECRYYEFVLKRKCFRKLKINVWERKFKWKLEEKADEHLRRVLTRKSFDLWLVFIDELYVERTNRKLAISFYEGKIKRKGLSALRTNVEKSYVQSEIFKLKSDSRLLCRAWHKWKHYTLKRLKVRQVKNLANDIRQRRLILRFLYIWSCRMKEKYYLQEIERRGARTYGEKVLKKYFLLWKIVCRERALKRGIAELSSAFYKKKLKAKTFESWKKYTIQVKGLKTCSNQIRGFYESYLIKRYLGKWFEAYRKVKRDKSLRDVRLADTFHWRRVMERYFRHFREAVDKMKDTRDRMAEFQVRRAGIYLDFYIGLWRQRHRDKLHWSTLETRANGWRESYLVERYLGQMVVRYREHVEYGERVQEVVRYSDTVVLQRSFQGWKEFTVGQLVKKTVSESCREHFRENLKRKSLEKWRGFVGFRHRKKMAADYCRRVILDRALNLWLVYVREKREILSAVADLNRRHGVKLLTAAFGAWKVSVECTYEKTTQATCFYRRKTISRSFRQWVNVFQEKKSKRLLFERNSSIVRCVLVTAYLTTWRNVWSHKMVLNDRVREAETRRNDRVKRRVFRTWLGLVGKLKWVRERERIFPELKSAILLESYVGRFAELLEQRKVLREYEEVAGKAEETFVKRKYLRRWISFMAWRSQTILKCTTVHDNKCKSVRDGAAFGRAPQTGNPFIRRQPIIPEYLKTNLCSTEDEESFGSTSNDMTFRVVEPVNRRLPVVNQTTFTPFDF